MTGADLALAALIDRAGQTYTTTKPAYITYIERTHVTGDGRAEDIDRAVMVRVADDFAIMRDLPNGAWRTGPAFPVIPFFDPFSTFRFSYFANLKKIDITFDPGEPYYFNIPPADPGADVVIPYMSEYAPRFASDSTPDAPHFTIDPTSRTGNAFYPTDVRVDPGNGLPSHVTMQANGSDMTIGLDYGTVDGRWVITRGTWSATQHVFISTFKVDAVTTFSDFTFPAQAPDPRLAGPASPTPAATASPRARASRRAANGRVSARCNR
jgi:hypothetical protein